MYRISIRNGDVDRFIDLADDECFTPDLVAVSPTITTYNVWTSYDVIEVIGNEFPTALITTVE